jgi:hypothetical protein
VPSLEPSSMTTTSSTRGPAPSGSVGPWRRCDPPWLPRPSGQADRDGAARRAFSAAIAAASGVLPAPGTNGDRAWRRNSRGNSGPGAIGRGSPGGPIPFWLGLSGVGLRSCPCAHRERPRDRPDDAAATSFRTRRPEWTARRGARCQCLTDEQLRAVLRSASSTSGQGGPAMPHVESLRCRVRRTCDVAPLCTCEWCFGPRVAYDYEAIAAGQPCVDRRGQAPSGATDLLPRPHGRRHPARRVDAADQADRLAAKLGLGELWVKDDTRNPTNSFKDRCRRAAKAPSSASRRLPARRRATSPTRSPPTRPRRPQQPCHPRRPRVRQDRHDVRTRNVVLSTATCDVNRLCAESPRVAVGVRT